MAMQTGTLVILRYIRETVSGLEAEFFENLHIVKSDLPVWI
jgi:hypothetical protein